MQKYSIGIDFGTESGRAVLVSLTDGKEIADHVVPYQDGVIDSTLPGEDKPLGHEWALQNPADYLDVLSVAVPEVLKKSGAAPEEIAGIGIDFTASTILPIDEEGVPLCMKDEYRDRPHSWVKLWKHHAAQGMADRLNRIAEERGEAFLKRYGGKISSEWMIPKIMQIVEEDPEIYDATDQFVEAADWIVSQMTGTLVRNSCTAGYKAIWNKQHGYPDDDFFEALHPKMKGITKTKLRAEVVPLGTSVGAMTQAMARKMNVPETVQVAVGNVDAHVSVPAMGVGSPGKLVMTMGTSICHMLLGKEEVEIEGVCGVVEDGIIPGYFGYEAGQSAVGDIFGWFVDEQVPAYIEKEAEEEKVSVHEVLEQKATRLNPGESGLLALDWWNGNRSVLVDTSLSGMILGMTLQTKPEEIYRALIEATAFGTKRIIESFETKGLEIEELYACGGLPQKNRLLLQIYADVAGKPVVIADSIQTPALGAAMFGAVASGYYNSIEEAAEYMGRTREEKVYPDASRSDVYDRLYDEYRRLHDYFGRGENDVMKRLKQMRNTSQKV